MQILLYPMGRNFSLHNIQLPEQFFTFSKKSSPVKRQSRSIVQKYSNLVKMCFCAPHENVFFQGEL